MFTTLFGLLASSGLRVSEALALRFGDVTSDGLVICKTKFNKSRLVPLHGTAASALGRYLELRRRASTVSDYVFVSPKGGRLPSQTVSKTFLHLLACPRCGGRLRVIATVQDPLAVPAILAHLGRSLSPEAPGPAPPAPAASG